MSVFWSGHFLFNPIDWSKDQSIGLKKEKIRMEQLIKMGAYDAKTHFPELLRSVRNGKKFIITLRGVPVAELVPVGSLTRLDATRAAQEMEDFMKNHPPLQNVDIKALIEEGRS